MNNQERLVILSDAIRKMASDAYEARDDDTIRYSDAPIHEVIATEKAEWVATWIDNYLCEDLLEE